LKNGPKTGRSEDNRGRDRIKLGGMAEGKEHVRLRIKNAQRKTAARLESRSKGAKRWTGPAERRNRELENWGVTFRRRVRLRLCGDWTGWYLHEGGRGWEPERRSLNKVGKKGV